MSICVSLTSSLFAHYLQDLGASDTNITSHHKTEPDPSHDLNDDSRHHHFPEVPQHPLPPRFYDNPKNDYPTDVPPPPPSSYPSNDLHPPPTGPSETRYPHPYNHQPYHQDFPPPQHLPPPQNYPSHEPSPNSLPNFQSYPSFSESSLPSTPSHYQNPEPYYSSPHSAPAPSSTSFASAPPPPYSSANERINNNIAPVVDPSPSPAQKYHYDSSYQPGPAKIAEAHKAARFAVGALAFDDVSTAVEHLKKSLELLTNPSAGH